MVTSQNTTRTTMTNQSTKLLKQANVIRAHSIPIAPKHDRSNTTNYVWDQSFSFSDGHQSKIDISSLSSQNSHFSQRPVETKSHQASQPSTIGCVNKPLKSQSSSRNTKTRSTRLFPVGKSNRQRSSSSSGPRQDLHNFICRDLLLS
jgi:hypothetical protein